MKKFSVKIFLFIFIVVLFLYGAHHVNERSINNANFKLCDSTETIFIGNSVISDGINPDSIPRSINIALASEPYCMTFFILRDILSPGTNLKRVVTNCSLVEMATQDNAFILNKSHSVELYSRLFTLKKYISLNELKYFKNDLFTYYEILIRSRIFPNYPFLIKNISENIKCNDNKYLLHIGKYVKKMEFNRNKTTDEVNEMIYDLKKHFPEYDVRSKSVVNLKYLDSIADLCLNYKIDLILVGMPFPDELLPYVNGYYVDFYNKFVQEFTSRRNIRFVDFNHRFELDRFTDFFHINDAGADMLSGELRDSLLISEKEN